MENATQRIYTPITKVDTEKRLVYGPVLVPETFDSQDHIISVDEIEKSAHEFLALFNIYTGMGVMHEELNADIIPVQSFIAPVDYTLGDEEIKKGTWMLVSKVLDDDIWQQVKDGELRGYSIGGKATSEEVDEEGNAIEE